MSLPNDGPGTGRSSRSGRDAWRSLQVAERYQVMWAMVRGRPLPARLARVAIERGCQMRGSASFFGYFYLVLGEVWLTIAVTDVVRNSPEWTLACYWFAAVGFLSLGAAWLAFTPTSSVLSEQARGPNVERRPL